MFVYRERGTEVYIYVPHAPSASHRPLRVLDRKYMSAHSGASYGSIEWQDEKGRRICGEEFLGYEGHRSKLRAYLKTFWTDEEDKNPSEHWWQLIGRSETMDTKDKTKSDNMAFDEFCRAMRAACVR